MHTPSLANAVTGFVHALADVPDGREGQVLAVMGIACMGVSSGSACRQFEAFSFQIATEDQVDTNRYWNAVTSNGGQESASGSCKDRWGVLWQIVQRTLTEGLATGAEVAARTFAAMMPMGEINVAAIDAARRG